MKNKGNSKNFSINSISFLREIYGILLQIILLNCDLVYSNKTSNIFKKIIVLCVKNTFKKSGKA